MRKTATASPVKHPLYNHRDRFPGAGGKTQQKYFTKKTDALLFAKARDKELGRSGSDFGTIAADKKAAVAFWRECQ